MPPAKKPQIKPAAIRARSVVEAMEVASQRQVLEQLISDELHRRKMRLPRAA